MNIREHISALCPQPISPEIQTFHAYDPEDIAYALAGLSRLQSDLMRTKYALELNRLQDLGIGFYLHILDWWQDRVIPMDRIGREFRRQMSNLGVLNSLRKNPELIQQLTHLALHDHIHHHTCTVCQGRSNLTVEAKTLKVGGKDYHQGAVIVCFNCAGLGRKRQTGTERAKIMGISQPTWSRNYEPIFRELSSILDQEEVLAAKIMRDRLG